LIAALTADVGPGIESECKTAGMDYYLSKPVQKNELLEILDKCNEIFQESKLEKLNSKTMEPSDKTTIVY
jgi:CheY-like chemotaxis protein